MWRLIVIAMIAFGSGCSSCETAPTTGYEDVSKQIAEHLQKVGLGPGDVFEVAVYGEPEMSGLYRVSADGGIQFPLINRVAVEGMTPTEIADEIQKRLQDGYLKTAIVNVFVKEYNSKKVFVLGEVQKPGTFPYAARMNIVEAITLAGGFLDSANEDYVVVTRQDAEGKDQRFPIPVAKITQGEAPNFNLQPGDIIFVPDTLL